MHKKTHNRSSAKRQSSQTHFLRIIGGQWRSRKLGIAALEGLRPTSSRLRETLFNWLHHELANAKVLDLFAGTGALGLEALSRGATQATFLEIQPQAITQLEQNLAALKCSQGTVKKQSAIDYLQSTQPPETGFDIVFLDPPFALNLWQDCLNLLSHGWLSPNGLIYVEMPSNALQPVLTGWKTYKHTKVGNVQAFLFHTLQDTAVQDS